jgi:hypothetical protein
MKRQNMLFNINQQNAPFKINNLIFYFLNMFRTHSSTYKTPYTDAC